MTNKYTLLTQEEIYNAILPLCSSVEIANSLVEISLDEYRAIEAAVIQKFNSTERTNP